MQKHFCDKIIAISLRSVLEKTSNEYPQIDFNLALKSDFKPSLKVSIELKKNLYYKIFEVH